MDKKADRNNKVRFIVLIVLCVLLCEGWSHFIMDAKLEGPYDVTRVVDGDTIVVNIDGEDTKVRMIGIDTPESVASDESRNTPEGVIASDYTKSILEGTKVYLEYDQELYDQYGRTLAYVFKEDKRTMIQEELLAEGYARVMTVEPNTKYVKTFEALESKAK